MKSRLVLCILGRGQSTHRQCVDLLPHSITQRLIHLLMTRNARLPFKRGTYDQRLKMPAISVDLNHVARKPTGNVALDIGRHGFHQLYLTAAT